MTTILRQYIKESLALFLAKNKSLENFESQIFSEISTLFGGAITGHVSATSDDEGFEDDLKDIASSFGGGEFAE